MDMASTIPFHGFEQAHDNLWKRDGKYYRLFGDGITPNGCWRINPYLRELSDIDAATGRDIYGEETIYLEYSTVPSCYPVLKRGV